MSTGKLSENIKNPPDDQMHLRLYILGNSMQSTRAVYNIKQLIKQLKLENCKLEIIDLSDDPRLGFEDHIIAVPTLVRLSPLPVKKVIGDLTDPNPVIETIGLEQFMEINIPPDLKP